MPDENPAIRFEDIKNGLMMLVDQIGELISCIHSVKLWKNMVIAHTPQNAMLQEMRMMYYCYLMNSP